MRTYAIAIALCLAILPSCAYAKSNSQEVMLGNVGALHLEYRATEICPDFTASLDLNDTEKIIDMTAGALGKRAVYARLKKVDKLIAELITSGGKDAFCSLAKHFQTERAG